MKACVLYFSATGNTKKFAQAISNSLKIPLFNVEKIQPHITKDYIF
jgi:flavodoxin